MPARHSPLDRAHRALGARMVDFGGWEMPLVYPSGTLAEHRTCRKGAVAFDVSHLGTVRVAGPEAFDILQCTLSNDLAKIGPGKAQYTHLLDPADGSVLDDIIVWWVDGQEFQVMPNASNTARVVQAIGGDDITSERAIIAVQGPHARAWMADVVPDAVDLPRFAVRSFRWKGAPCTVAGTGYTGEDGFECSIPAPAAAEFWDAVLDAGVMPAGLGARDTLRLEAGLPLHGHELGPGITPLQAGLGWVVAWEKGEFPGRSALEDERRRGVSRRLRGLEVDGRQPPRAGYRVLLPAGRERAGPSGREREAGPSGREREAGEVVGVVSSGNFSPTLGRGIAFAFVQPHLEVGSDVTVDARGQTLVARVVATPFVHRESGEAT